MFGAEADDSWTVRQLQSSWDGPRGGTLNPNDRVGGLPINYLEAAPNQLPAEPLAGWAGGCLAFEVHNEPLEMEDGWNM